MARDTLNLTRWSILPLLISLTFHASAQFQAVVTPDHFDGTRGFVLNGEEAGDQSGFSVSFAGDINDDGTDDLIIGAPNASPTGAGSGNSYVLFGSTNPNGGFSGLFLSGLDGTRGFALNGEAAGDRSGFSVSFAGDINDDGKDDLIIGAPSASPFGAGSGNSYVLFGSTNPNGGFSDVFLSGLDGTRGFALNGEAAGDSSGYSVSYAGDINDDGKDDLVIGAPSASPSGAGSGNSYVLFGNTNPNGGFSDLFLSGLNGTRGFALNGEAAGDNSGYSVSYAGDINDDGKDDLIIGAPRASPSVAGSGNSYVLFGNTNPNGGFSDLFLSGLDGIRGFALNGVAEADNSGSSVSTVADINGDGTDDLIIGAPNEGTNGAGSGAVYVLFGGVNVNQTFSDLFLSGLNGDRGFTLRGEEAGDHFGYAVSFAGDLNDDGIDDLVIGSPDASPNGVGSGASYVLFGSKNANNEFSTLSLSDLNGSNGFKMTGAQAGDHFGFSVGFAGDINADGVDDLVIGAPDADPNGEGSGNSYVLFGRKNLVFSDGFEPEL
jgi:hypothetical protein